MHLSDSKLHNYTLYGLNVFSPTPLPLLDENGEAKSGLLIDFKTIKDIPKDLAAIQSFWIQEPWLNYRCFEGSWWVEYKDLFFCRVSHDNITVYLGINDTPNDYWPYITGTCISLFLLLKGRFSLHGSMINWKGKGILITGHSAAGKSTTTTWCLEAGACLISDDMIVTKMNKGIKPIAQCGMPWVKLWDDTLQKMGEDPAEFPEAIKGSSKRILNMQDKVCDHPSPLDLFIEIIPDGDIKEVQVERIAGFEAFGVIAQHIYRPKAIPVLGMEKEHFKFCSQLSAHVPIYQLRRPLDKWSPDEVLNSIKELVGSSEFQN